MTTAGLVMASANVRESIDTNKLTHPNKVIRPFEEGREFVRVTVNLNRPQSALDRTNWRSEHSRGALRKEIRSRQQQVLDTLSQGELLLRHRYKNMNSFSGEITLACLEKLSNDPRVESIEPVIELQAHGAQGISLMNALDTRSVFNGQGVAIAICDTGIDYTHPMLGGGGFPNNKVIGGHDFGDDDTDPKPDGEAHGTACAGIAAGDVTSVGDYIGGVAYGAKLYALKVTSGSSGSAYTDDIAAAWDWCVTHQNDDPSNPIMVISTSFGGSRYFSSCDGASSVAATAANNAVAAGITLLVSSGNNGYCDSISFPACISNVISVGAVYDTSFGIYQPCVSSSSCANKTSSFNCSTFYRASDNTAADKVTSYSNTASFLDVLAPSNQAYTTDITGSGGYAGGDYHATFGGTSAACPYAAGIVAILQEASKAITGDYLTPGEVRVLLTVTGDDVTDGKVAITKPRINLDRAMDFIDLTDQNPPTADDITVSIPSGTSSASVTLNAVDDGFPWGTLDYIITSLPTHGFLLDPATQTLIKTTPYTLSGDTVDYMLRPNCDIGIDFAYLADDGGTAPEGGPSNEAIVTIYTDPLQVMIYSADMDADPNWSFEGDWAWGQPAGGGGTEGNADPSSGYTGSNVVGYNLNGDYPELLQTQWAMSPAIDCNEYTGTALEFYRWLNVDEPANDLAFVEVSNDGTTWTTIWQNTESITDSSWVFQTFDISAIADKQSTVYIRWGMGATDSQQDYSGWNIDDVKVIGLEPLIPPIPGDFESDCDVDLDDLIHWAAYWLASCGDCAGTDLSGDGSIKLDWDDNSEGDIDTYTVYRSTASGSGFTEIAAGLTSSDYTDSNITEGITYYYLVTATDTDGNESEDSDEVSVTSLIPAVVASSGLASGDVPDELTLTSASTAPGLWYGIVAGNIDTATANPQTSVTTDLTETEDSIAINTTEIYTGEIYDADGSISFTEHIDDKARIYIDDILVLSDDDWKTRTSTANLNLSPGWHTIEIRISNGGGPGGPTASPGIGYDPDGGTAWIHPEDPGDGSLFRHTTGDTTAPAAPTGLTATAGDGIVNLADFQIMADHWLENYYAPVLDLDLMGYWKFDETAGPVASDASLNVLNGTLQNMDDSDWVPGKVGNALNFDGSNDFVEITGFTGLTGTQARTCTAWVKTGQWTRGEFVAWGSGSTNETRWAVGIENHVLRVDVQNGSISGTRRINDNQWHHIAVTWKPNGNTLLSNAKLYVDGVLESVGDIDNIAVDTDTDEDVHIGNFSGTNHFQGLLDDVRIYKKELTAQEIQDLL